MEYKNNGNLEGSKNSLKILYYRKKKPELISEIILTWEVDEIQEQNMQNILCKRKLYILIRR